MIKKKMIVNKIGYIYCVEIEARYKIFLQYIAIDSTQLYSQVLRVFATRYPMDYIPDINEITEGSIAFYTHIYNLSDAIREGVWYKVGKHSDVGNLEDVCFRGCQDVDGKTMKPRFHWYVWKINQDTRDVGEELPKEYLKMDDGAVYPYEWITEKIKTGKYTDDNNLYVMVKDIINSGRIKGKAEFLRVKNILREKFDIFNSEEMEAINQLVNEHERSFDGN